MEDAEDDADGERDPTADMYAKYDACLHGPRAPGEHPPLSLHFLKKFFAIIKRRARCRPGPAHSRLRLLYTHRAASRTAMAASWAGSLILCSFAPTEVEPGSTLGRVISPQNQRREVAAWTF